MEGVCVRWIWPDAVYDLVDAMLAMEYIFDTCFICFAYFYAFITTSMGTISTANKV